MSRQKGFVPIESGFAHLILLLAILALVVAAVVGYLFYTKKLPGFFNTSTSSSTDTEDSSSLLKTEYQNPFEERSSYSNPFSESTESGYKNPFDNLSQ